MRSNSRTPSIRLRRKSARATTSAARPRPSSRRISNFQLRQVRDVLIGKLAKRGVDVRFLDESKAVEKIGGDKLKQTIVVKSGIDKDLGKKIQTTVKNAKALKLSASLQGDVVRVSGAKRDALQECIALLRKEIEEAPLSFGNFRN